MAPSVYEEIYSALPGWKNILPVILLCDYMEYSVLGQLAPRKIASQPKP